jgi:capsular exopolysaccharide synthesis family protein
MNSPRLDGGHLSEQTLDARGGNGASSPAHAANGSPPAALSTMPSALGLLTALKRRWPVAVFGGLALAGIAAAAMWFAPFLSTAGSVAVVKIDSHPKMLMEGGWDHQVDFERYQKNQAALVKSRPVIQEALARPEIAGLAIVTDNGDPVEWLERDLTVDTVATSEQMRVILRCDRPKEALPVLDAIVDVYLDMARKRARSERIEKIETLTRQLSEKQDELERQKLALRSRPGAADLDDPDGILRQRAALAKLEQAEKELEALRSEQSEKELLFKGMQGGNLPHLNKALDDEVEAKLASDTDAAKLLDGVAELRRLIAVTEKLAQDPEKATADQRRRLADAEAQLEVHRRRVRQTLQSQNPTRPENDLLGLKARLDVLKVVIPAKEERIKQLREESKAESILAPDLQRMKKEITNLEKTTDDIRTRLTRLRIELDAPDRATLFQPAAPLPADTKKQQQMAGITGMGVFTVAIFGFAWWEFRARRVSNLDEIATGLGIPLLGAVPMLPARVRGQMAQPKSRRDSYWYGLLNESLDVTRTMLLHAAQTEPMQVVLVTSAVEGEGKTSLASQLAASLARAGRRTLLLDADLRKPAAHRLFEVPLEPGFSELLRAEVNLSDVIRPTRLSRLWMLPAGVWDNHATQALAQDHVQAIFEELRGQYDFIIVDSCPVLPVVDSLLIAQHTDAVLFSVLRDTSQLPKVYAAHQRLASLGVRLLGAVVTGASGDVYGSTYYRNAVQRTAG